MRTAAQRPRPAREPGRVHWMELFFDLVFVAFIGQLAHGIHGDPGWPEFGTYVLLFFPAWWAWVNIVSVINLLPGLTSRVLGLSMVAAMAAAGLMAAAAPHAFGERAWAFSLANAAMRVLLLVLWLHGHRQLSPEQPWRIGMYTGGTALLWFIAVFLPLHAAVILWAAAIAVEVGMIAASRWIGAQRNLGGINLEHATERLGLFVVIVLGESIFTIVSELAQDWHPGPALASALGFMIVALLGWAFFQYGMDVLATGLGQLRKREDFSGILQTTLFMPFALVLGVTSIAAAIATAIPAPNTLLPPGAAVALGGGLALFYGTNAIVSLRFGTPLRSVLPWGIPSVLAALVLVPLGGRLPAAVVLALAVALLLFLTVQAEANARRRPGPP